MDPAGRTFYSAAATSAAQEPSAAKANFFAPRRHRDPFGKESVVDYDGPSDPSEPRYNLLPGRSVDAAGNAVSAVNDYRV